MTARLRHGAKSHRHTHGADPGSPHERLHRMHAQPNRAEGQPMSAAQAPAPPPMAPTPQPQDNVGMAPAGAQAGAAMASDPSAGDVS